MSAGKFKKSSATTKPDGYDNFTGLSLSSLLAQGEIPPSHKRVADNYMVIKKIYGFNTLQTRISNADKALLAKYDFTVLEYSTIKQVNEEIDFMKKWSASPEPKLRAESNELLNIRMCELKFIITNKYTVSSNELYNGYLALEKYFETISKY